MENTILQLRAIRLTLAYDGTGFCGWQRQKNDRTVQGELEEKLTRMTGEKIVLHGAGRTDSGVHALAMTAHFSTRSVISCASFKSGLNSLLDNSIKITEVKEVDSSFHSRIAAKAKIYQYYFSTEDIILPHRRLYCAHLPGSFDLERARQCLPFILGKHDFSCFEAVGSRDRGKKGGKGAVREILHASLAYFENPAKEYLFEICGDGFLRKMVRNIVGTLVEVGQKRMNADQFASLLRKGDRSEAGPTAPACGLFLKKIYYDKSW